MTRRAYSDAYDPDLTPEDMGRPTWFEAQADAIFDARAAAADCRDTDPDLAAWWTREADRLEDQAWQRRERGRR